MRTSALFACVSLMASAAHAWLPGSKIRGVNLGGLFIIEPWMMSQEWNSMGCGGQNSEFDCMMALGQDAGDTAFQKHWDTWITEDDFKTMSSYGLNVVRIPLGYWLDESVVDRSSEHFPKGAQSRLDKVVGWAKTHGISVILDLHGAPGAQEANQPFTGQYASSVGFYNDYQYGRTYKFLEYITNITHTNDAYSNVFAIEVLNEPVQDTSKTSSMINTFYPTAYNTIRSVEEKLGVPSSKTLHIQFMDKQWGSGDPTSALPTGWYDVITDNHDYVKWSNGVTQTRDGYLKYSCANTGLGANVPVVVGEWSLSVNSDYENKGEFALSSSGAVDFYLKWWKAQVTVYEKQQGWIFWSWKTELGSDYRWGYSNAVTAGAIPKDASTGASSNVC